MRNSSDPGTLAPLAVLILLVLAALLSLETSILNWLWCFARSHPDKYVTIGLVCGLAYGVIRGHAKLVGFICIVGFITLFVSAMIFEGALAFFDAITSLSSHLDQSHLGRQD